MSVSYLKVNKYFIANMAVKKCCCAKLSPNKKSIFGFGMESQVLYLLLISSFLAIASAADTEISCTNVKNIFERKGMLSSVDIQEQPNSGENWKSCALFSYLSVIILSDNEWYASVHRLVMITIVEREL